MAKDIKVSWGYSETRRDPLPDETFYRSLPGMTENERYELSDGVKGKGGGPEFQQLIFWGGSTVLSSSILAAAIKAYVALKKRKVVITIGDKKLEYEGSDLAHDQETIEAMIDKLTDEESTTSVVIFAPKYPKGLSEE
jgi:hypothetical protein